MMPRRILLKTGTEFVEDLKKDIKKFQKKDQRNFVSK